MSLLLLLGGYAPVIIIPPLASVGFIEGAGAGTITEGYATGHALDAGQSFGSTLIEGAGGVGD